MSENVSPIKYFLSGGFGGVCTVVAGHPLDTIKVSTRFNYTTDGLKVICGGRIVKCFVNKLILL